MLEITAIRTTLHEGKFDEGVHYKKFSIKSVRRDVQEVDIALNKMIETRQVVTYLSYWGLVRLLYVRKHPIAVNFQRWAMNKLFTVQFGTADQKRELAADVIGVTPSAIKAFLNTNVNTMPVVYLFDLGSVKDLRDALKIPNDAFKDDDVVFKYGLTNDLKRRTVEHDKTFGKLPNFSLNLKYHVYIDPVYLSKAEAELEQWVKGTKWWLDHPKHKELCIIPSQYVDNIVHEKFKNLGSAFSGKLDSLQKQLAEEKRVNEKHIEHIRLLEKQMDRHERDMRALIDEKDARLRDKEEMLTLYRKLLQN